MEDNCRLPPTGAMRADAAGLELAATLKRQRTLFDTF